jgi:hypothetical protein
MDMVAGVAALAIALGGVQGAAEAPPPPAPRVVIGHDSCAILLELQSEVADVDGRPLKWAYVTLKDEPQPRGLANQPTDSAGRVRTWVCYLGSREYRERPPNGRVVLEFTVLKAGYRAKVLRKEVAASTLIREGSPSPTWSKRKRLGYVVKLKATLERERLP